MKTHGIRGATIALGALALTGCVGSNSFELKTPVSDQCANAALQACDELSEGVLLQAEGRKSEATAKLQSGAAQNPPEKVKQFAERLQTLATMPGASKYAAALNETAATLALFAPAPPAGSPSADDAALTERGPSTLPEAYKARGFLTADSDVQQSRSGVGEVPAEPPEWCDNFGKGTKCIMLAHGPLFLTEAIAPSPECKGQFLAIVGAGQKKVELPSPLSIHGARILVPTKAALILGQRPEPPKEDLEEPDPKKPAPKKPGVKKPVPLTQIAEEPPSESYPLGPSPDWSCSLYWSGFAPYDAPPAKAAPPSPDFAPPVDGTWNQESGF